MRTALAALAIFFSLNASADCGFDIDCLRAENARLAERNRVLEERASQPALQVPDFQPLQLPVMPVSVSLRRAAFGPGLVAVFNTTVKESFPVLVTVRSRQLGSTSGPWRMDLDWQVAKELGHAEGVPIGIGDEIRITNQRFQPLLVTVKP